MITSTKQNLPPLEHGWAFFLDVDGTLLDLAEHPAAVMPSVQVQNILAAFHSERDIPVALISGRSISELDRLFHPLCLPCAGQHGAERRAASGKLHGLGQSAALASVRTRLQNFVSARPGLLLEDKGLCLSVHFRQVPSAESEVEAMVRDVVHELNGDYAVQPGKMVFEIRPRHCDKGTSIAAFMAESPFAERLPVFIGDDLTDEHGFELVNQLKGHTVKVGPGPSCARWRIEDASTVVAWLESYLKACGEPRG